MASFFRSPRVLSVLALVFGKLGAVALMASLDGYESGASLWWAYGLGAVLSILVAIVLIYRAAPNKNDSLGDSASQNSR